MKTVLLSTILLLLSLFSIAQPGTLDKSFGTKGRTVFHYGTDRFYSCIGGVVQKDNKILAITTPYWGFSPSGGFSLTRFLPDGTYDTTFADSGRVDIILDFAIVQATCFAQQQDGKILIAGYGYSISGPRIYSGIIVRLNSNGTSDKTFGENGVVKNTFTNDVFFNTISITPDNKIIAAGTASGFSSLVSCYLPDGKPDASFGNQGNVELSNAYILSSIVQPDGKILVGGATTGNGDATSFLLARYAKNGTLDQSFGENGVVITSYKDLTDRFLNLAIQKDNKIIAAGTFGDSSVNVVLRYAQNGIIDSSFGNSGAAETVYNDTSLSINDVTVQPDGKLLFSGGAAKTSSINAVDFCLFQLNANGGLDSAFGSFGKTIINITGGLYNRSALYSLSKTTTFQSNGKIVLIGYSIQQVNEYRNRYFISLVRCYGEAKQQSLLTKSSPQYFMPPAGDFNIRLYPNPATGKLIMSGLSATNTYQLSVKDKSGLTVLSASIKAESTHTLNIQNLQKGIYYLSLTPANGSTVNQTFIKQ